MVVGIVGSRKGASLEDVAAFCEALYARDPETIVVSGGAAGVDTEAERTWLLYGGRVVSFRPTKLGDEEYAVEKWLLGFGQDSRVEVLEPTFANFTSAAIYRDALIAGIVNRLVTFMPDRPTNGTTITIGFAEAAGKPVHKYTQSRRFRA